MRLYLNESKTERRTMSEIECNVVERLDFYEVPKRQYLAMMSLIKMHEKQINLHNKNYDELYRQKSGETKEMIESERKANELLTSQVEKLEAELNEAKQNKEQFSISRLEIIGPDGRELVEYNNYDCHLQDDGKTLKLIRINK